MLCIIFLNRKALTSSFGVVFLAFKCPTIISTACYVAKGNLPATWITWGRGAILAVIWSRMPMTGFSYGCLAWKWNSIWMKVMPGATFPWTFHCLRFSSSDKNMFWLGVVKGNLTLSANSSSDWTKRRSLVEEGVAAMNTGTQSEREAKCLQGILCNFSKKV